MQQSFAWRIAVAVALLVGFSVAALAIGIGALALAVLQWTTDLPQNVWLTLAGVVTAFVILTSIVPRRQRCGELGIADLRLAGAGEPDPRGVGSAA